MPDRESQEFKVILVYKVSSRSQGYTETLSQKKKREKEKETDA